MSKIDGLKLYNSLPEGERKFVAEIIETTLDCVNEMLEKERIVFYESAAYRALTYDVLGHVVNKEYFDPNDGLWKKTKEEQK